MPKRTRSKWFLPLLIVAVVLVAGAASYYFGLIGPLTGAARAQATTETPLQTATVRRGDLVVSATGAGSVIPATEVNLAFVSGGLLVELPVRVGSKVQAGDVLARLDDTSARSQVAQAELNLAQAQLQLEKLVEGATTAELAAAEATLASAQANLENLQSPAAKQENVAAQQNLLSAQQKLADLLAGPTAEEITTAKADLRLAEIAVQQAQADYDKVSWRADIGQLSQSAALEEATLAYEKAKANYETSTKGATAAEISAARAAVAQAKAQISDLKGGSTAHEVTAAQANVEQAQAQLDTLRAGASSIELQLAQITVKQAENTLASAQADLEGTVLKAPIAGTITAISGSVGERVSGNIVTLADLAQPLVEVYLDQNDLDKVGLDYEAEVTFDALPDQVFTGHVTQVDPQLVTSNGVTTVHALVQLDAATSGQQRILPVGLNASVDVIAGRATQALLVPVEALREISAGEYAVFVVKDSKPTLQMVKVGLMDATYAEITSGLNQGDVVTTGIVETQSS